jgi:hypothetical protein
MMRSDSAVPRLLRGFCTAVLLGAAALLTGCATHYVDATLKDVPAAQFTRPAQPKPVQLIFDFQTKGVTNARAAEQIKPMVAEAVRTSALFAELRDAPGQGAGLLSVTLNNVPIGDDAAAKGFIAGLTFGAAGQQVTDGYICTVSYLAPGQSTPVVKTSRHAIHTTVGAKTAPANTYPATSIDESVRMMVRQAVGNALLDLSRDAAFR